MEDIILRTSHSSQALQIKYIKVSTHRRRGHCRRVVSHEAKRGEKLAAFQRPANALVALLELQRTDDHLMAACAFRSLQASGVRDLKVKLSSRHSTNFTVGEKDKRLFWQPHTRVTFYWRDLLTHGNHISYSTVSEPLMQALGDGLQIESSLRRYGGLRGHG